MDLFFDASVLPLPEVGHITAAFLQEKLHGTPARREASVKLIPRLVCNDGFSLSVQASEIHSSLPQRRVGPYSHVECACPSEPVQELMPFLMQEEGISPEQSVYVRVPIEIVQSILNSHGGLRA